MYCRAGRLLCVSAKCILFSNNLFSLNRAHCNEGATPSTTGKGLKEHQAFPMCSLGKTLCWGVSNKYMHTLYCATMASNLLTGRPYLVQCRSTA